MQFISVAIFESPDDYPGKFVARVFRDETRDPVPLIVCDTLQQARSAVYPGMVKMAPMPGDVKSLREVWI
jgi:hypothetical protein